MLITIILVIAGAVGVFVFVKNNPNKTKSINDVVKAQMQRAKLAAEAEAAKLKKK